MNWLWPLVTMLISQAPGQPTGSQPGKAAPAAATGFLYKTLELKGESFAYCVYVPPEYTPDKPWPVILFLHGSGERGSDGFLQTEIGIGTAIRRNRLLCPAVVVMPQCRPNHWWTDAMAEMALKCVEQTSREYNLDPQRVYLTGLSMGGAGVWFIASRMPDRFAAISPICGFWTLPDKTLDDAAQKELAKLAGIPNWCYHGGADPAVPVLRSREIIGALRAAGGSPKYTELAEAGHNVWDVAYGNTEWWKWLLAQKRSANGKTEALRPQTP